MFVRNLPLLPMAAAVAAFATAAVGLPSTTLGAQRQLAATPPMGWNDWAHYQCDFTASTILANARALVRTGLAARGYDTVTIDDCWMLKERDSHGDLQPDPARFPHGMRPVAAAIHALGLRFGIYQDAGAATCGGFAGSGSPASGSAASGSAASGSAASGSAASSASPPSSGEPHFAADARLFAAWGVDYLKLDGCNVHPDQGAAGSAAYRAAYRAESVALEQTGRPIVFSESAPAYFQGSPDWYDVLGWVRGYGQLWREGTDIEIYDRKKPDRSRFDSVMWNYDYNLQLGRFQKPGNWNDADFIIGGDRGLTLAESRSQLALWSMMSAPLILSSDLDSLSPAAIAILGNRGVLAVDQDRAGMMATLLRRSASMDVLMKPLRNGGYAVAVLNRSPAPLHVRLLPRELGFTGGSCRLEAEELWSGAGHGAAGALDADIQAHDTEIWRIRLAHGCAVPARIGAITRIVPDGSDQPEATAAYTRCVASPGTVQPCAGTLSQMWQITADGALRSGQACLTQTRDRAVLATCRSSASQRWRYTLSGNLINRDSHLCLTGPASGALTVQACGHNLASQVWSLPNGMTTRRVGWSLPNGMTARGAF